MAGAAAVTGWHIDPEVWTCPSCQETHRLTFHPLTPKDTRAVALRKVRDRHVCKEYRIR